MKKKAPETKAKESEAGMVYTLDSYRRGISLSKHRSSLSQTFLKVEREDFPLRSRYTLFRGDPVARLEQELHNLSQSGDLAAATIIYGNALDPFHPFEGRFDTSMRMLELFKRYSPGKLYLQTRSPLVVIALPVFQHLAEVCSIRIGIETHLENMVSHYTPSLPRVRERVKTIRALKRFGIDTSVQVSPLLPYGEWRKDATDFASFLAELDSNIFLHPLNDGSPECEQSLRLSSIAKKLAHERKFFWLRKDAHLPLEEALINIVPEKFCPSPPVVPLRRQLEMFAA